MLLPSIRMKRTFQLAYRMYLIPHRTCIFQCLKGQPSLLNPQYKKVSLALSSQHECLHASVTVCVSKETKSLGKASPQPEDSHSKELNKETQTSNLAQGAPVDPNFTEVDPLQDKSLSLVQRFKKGMKQYGRVLISVHLFTSSIWFGAFYYATLKGVNVGPYLEFLGMPETLVNILKNSQGTNLITAYAIYKVATPARYFVTFSGTSITVKYLRKYGYLSTPPPVKEYIQDRVEETKERLSGKMEETRDMINEKMEETKERLTGKMEETKEKLTGKMEETKGRITEKIQETKEKVSFIKQKE